MRSKLNRKRVDVRIPHWFRETIKSIEDKYQLTFTEALIRCGEKGAAYYEKQWAAKQKQKSQQDALDAGSDNNVAVNQNHQQQYITETDPNIEELIRIAKTPWVNKDE